MAPPLSNSDMYVRAARKFVLCVSIVNIGDGPVIVRLLKVLDDRHRRKKKFFPGELAITTFQNFQIKKMSAEKKSYI